MSETNEPVVMQVPDLTTDNTKAEIIDHIRREHIQEGQPGEGFYVGQGYSQHFVDNADTKVTKANLLRHHEQLHRTEEWSQRGNFVSAWDTRGRPLTNPHQHVKVEDVTTPITLTDEQQQMLAAARENKPLSEKPLTATERKVMKELVDNDFNGLKQEAKQFAADALLAAHQQIEADWQDRVAKGPGYAKKAADLATKHATAAAKLAERIRKMQEDLSAKQQAEFAELREAAEGDGIEISSGTREYDAVKQQHVTVYKTDAKGRKEALAEATSQNTAFLNRGILALEQQRIAAQRRVLISGVTAEAAAFLDEMPDARTMMVEAQRQQAELESGKDA